jgi:tyrosine-protein kinase Etk/Wzc
MGRTVQNPTVSIEPVDVVSNSENEQQEFALVDILLLLAQRKRILFGWTLAGSLLACLIAFVTPVTYEGDSSILPPQQSMSSASAVLGQLGGLLGASGSGAASLKNPSDVWVDILKSRTVADALIQKFDLRTVYRQKRLSDTEKILARHSEIEAAKDGIVKIAVRDRDPSRAAGLANGYVSELYIQNQRLVITEAGQRRLFFEQQLATEKDALASAEVALKQSQMKTGILELQGQTQTAIRTIANLRADIASREVQKEALLASETLNNPDVQTLQQEIDAMKAQLSHLQSGSTDHSTPGDIEVPTSNMPAAALEYVRQLREVRYHETLFELLARQLEAAKIDESKSAPKIQVIDSALVPDHKAWPPKAIFLAVGIVAGLLIGTAWILISEGLRSSMQTDQAYKWKALKRSLSFTR